VIHITTVDMSLDLLLRPQLVAMAEAGFDVAGASAPGPHVEALDQVGIRHIALANSTRSMDPWKDLLNARDMVRMLRVERPDIVHTHNPKPGWFGRMIARAVGVPVVVNTVHGLYATPGDPWPRRALVYGLERLAAACSDAELLQSEEDVAVLRRLGVPADRIQVLGNGIDLARFRPPSEAERIEARRALDIPDGTLVVGAVGRLVWEKGYRELFAAAEALRDADPAVQFVVVGGVDPEKADGLGPADLAAVTERTGVKFLGERRDVEAVYAAMDIYVLASYREEFPRSAMEAAAFGLPVVATDIRGCRQVVDAEVTGLLVPAHDAHALGDAISRIAHDEELRRSMGAAAAAKARRDFDQERVIGRTLDTYRRLLGRWSD